jgi:N-acetylneuraminic acid mutarotase
VLAVGGAAGKSDSNDEVASTEIYDPATGTWTQCAPLNQGRRGPTATVLRSGKVLVTGGMYRRAGRLNSAEVFDPATGEWSDAGSMKGRRNGHRDIMLDDGRVLIAGGFSGINYLATCEIYSE